MEDITVQELKKLKDEGREVHLLDVREPWEHQEQNLGGNNIPLGVLPHQLSEIENYQDQELIVYCRTGNRSGQAKRYLSQNGFSQVRNLLGGVEAYMEL